MMAKMPVVILDEQPRPRADQVLVEIDLCGICGSDLHSPRLAQVYRGRFVLGHEMRARVVQAGADISGWSEEADDIAR